MNIMFLDKRCDEITVYDSFQHLVYGISLNISSFKCGSFYSLH
jgi:hypothetical protein